MQYIITVDKQGIDIQHSDAVLKKFEHCTILSKGIDESVLTKIADNYSQGTLDEYLSVQEWETFLLIVVDSQTKELHVYNDHFGSTDVMIHKTAEGFAVSDSVYNFDLGERPDISSEALYELTVFLDIQPPETIYSNVETLIAGHRATISKDTIEHIRYWKMEDLFKKKNYDYQALVLKTREAMLEGLRKQSPQETFIALSGGVDSGGLLGMATHELSRPIPSVTVGGHGPSSSDLTQSRISASDHGSINTELFPVFDDFKKYAEFSRNWNQPMQPDMALINCLIFEEAHKRGAQGLIYGVGAEMLLSNLKLSKIAYVLSPIEKVLPRWFLSLIYRTCAKIFGLSQNQKDFLLSFSWTERFMHARGAFFKWNQVFFLKDTNGLWLSIKNKIDSTVADIHIPLIDKIAVLYLFSWVNYIQYKDLTIMGRAYNIIPVIPFDTVQTVKVLFSVPTKHRKRNNWNKQLVRDVFRPFVSDEIYNGKVGSLIIPYNKIFSDKEELFFAYLENHVIIGEHFDIPLFKEKYNSLPEPGYFLWRLVGFAVWYDTNWQKENLEQFYVIFNEKNTPNA